MQEVSLFAAFHAGAFSLQRQSMRRGQRVPSQPIVHRAVSGGNATSAKSAAGGPSEASDPTP